MSEQTLTREVREAIIDRLQGWELIDFLQISIEDVIEAFEDVIVENIEDVKDFADIRSGRETSDGEDFDG